MMVQPTLPKILDPAVLDVDLDKKREIKVTELESNDRFPLKVIEVPDVYKDYVSVRQLALEIPAIYAHNIDKGSAFPGWRGIMILDQTPLWLLINKVLLEHLDDEWGGPFTRSLNFPFTTGIVNTKSIIRRVDTGHSLSGILPHRDQQPPSPGMIAGTIYLNLPEECVGGTSFYNPEKHILKKELMYEAKMVPNTMTLYQQRIPHSITQASTEDYREHFRIAQNFFIGEDSMFY